MTVLFPTVRNVRDVGKRTNDDQVYVGRRTKWGNPYKVGEAGTLEEVLYYFEMHLLRILDKDPDFLEPLRDKDLVCWCAPKPCHADILFKYLYKV